MANLTALEGTSTSEPITLQFSPVEATSLHQGRARFDTARWEEGLEPANNGSVIHAGPTSGCCCCSAGPGGPCKNSVFPDLAPIRLCA